MMPYEENERQKELTLLALEQGKTRRQLLLEILEEAYKLQEQTEKFIQKLESVEVA